LPEKIIASLLLVLYQKYILGIKPKVCAFS
jgi:hypothetical protein